MSEQQLSRRDFIKVTSAAIGAVISAIMGLPAIAYLISPALQAEVDTDSIDLGPLENFPVGMPTRFDTVRIRVNGWERTATTYGLFVLRTGEAGVRVFSDICTHLGCRVSWHPDLQHYISPCHDGHFDIAGNVVSGPPPRPLDEYIIKVENGHLFARLPPVKRTS